MIETQFAMNCNESYDDSALEVGHRGTSRPIDAAARSAHHRLRSPSDSLGDQSGAILPVPLVAGFFWDTFFWDTWQQPAASQQPEPPRGWQARPAATRGRPAGPFAPGGPGAKPTLPC